MPAEEQRKSDQSPLQEEYLTSVQDAIASTRTDIATLIQLITLRKKTCDELDDETQYMKEYVASFISTGDLKR